MADVHPETQEHAPETFIEQLHQLEALKYEAIHAGSAAAVEKQHAKGKYTARERIEKLLDPGSFQELDVFVRHRTTDFDMQSQPAVRGCGGDRSRHDRWPAGVCIQPGFHGVRWVAG